MIDLKREPNKNYGATCNGCDKEIRDVYVYILYHEGKPVRRYCERCGEEIEALEQMKDAKK